MSDIEALLARIKQIHAELRAEGEEHQHFASTYSRTTASLKSEVERGGFVDNVWAERWDLVFGQLYLDAVDAWRAGGDPPLPWRIAFDASSDHVLPPLRHVLIAMNAHINYDLPQALIRIIEPDEFDDRALMAKRSADHAHVDEILLGNVAAEDEELKAIEEPGDRTLLDWMLQPFNRSGTKRFLKEARRKVWANAFELNAARRAGPTEYAARLKELEKLSEKRVAELREPGQVLLRLAIRGFGVELAR